MNKNETVTFLFSKGDIVKGHKKGGHSERDPKAIVFNTSKTKYAVSDQHEQRIKYS